MEAARSLDAALREIVAAAVDARIGEVTARADAMVRLHGEFVKKSRAAEIMNVSLNTVGRMCKSGLLESTEPVGVSVRSIAALTDGQREKAAKRMRAPKPSTTFERIRP